MMKRIKRLCVLLTVLLLAALAAGCAGKGKDDDVLATVAGTPVYRWAFNVHMNTQLAAYQQYTGIDLTAAGHEAEFKTYKEARLEELIQEAAMKNEAEKRGLYELTQEEEAKLDQQYLDYYNESINALMAQSGATDDAARRKAEKDFETFLGENNLNPERVRQIMRDDYVLQKLSEQLNAGVQVEITEEELQNQYNTDLENQTAAMAENPLSFGSNTPSCPIVIPEGYVKVQRILVGFEQTDRERIASATQNVARTTQEWMIAASDFGETSQAAATKEKSVDAALATYNAVLRDACANIQEKADEILAKAKATQNDKEAFLELGATCTDDWRMADYYVCALSDHVEGEFRDAALAMTQPGSVSELVATESGYCIIYLDEICQPGVRSFEEVKETLREQMTLVRQAQEARDWRAEFAQKADEAGEIQRFTEKL